MASFPMALIGSAPSAMAASLVPIFALGMVYYRYLMADPESKIQEVQDVSTELACNNDINSEKFAPF